jgi:hypothetical protein
MDKEITTMKFSYSITLLNKFLKFSSLSLVDIHPCSRHLLRKFD